MDQSQIVALVVGALSGVVTGGVNASAVFVILEMLQTYIPMDGDTKRKLAPALAFVIPPIAYGLLILLAAVQFNPAMLLMSCFVGWLGAKRIHDTFAANQQATDNQQPATSEQ